MPTPRYDYEARRGEGLRFILRYLARTQIMLQGHIRISFPQKRGRRGWHLDSSHRAYQYNAKATSATRAGVVSIVIAASASRT